MMQGRLPMCGFNNFGHKLMYVLGWSAIYMDDIILAICSMNSRGHGAP